MKKQLITIMNIAVLLLVFSCSKDDDPVDPRLVFVGNYESKVHFAAAGDPEAVLDVKSVPAGITVPVTPSAHNPEALTVGMEELVTEVVKAFVPNVSYSVDFDELPLATFSANKFVLQATDFTIIDGEETAVFTLTGEGTLDGNTLTMKYAFSNSDNGNELLFESVQGEGNKMELIKQ